MRSCYFLPIIFLSIPAYAQQNNYIGLQFGYDTGDFGTSVRTDLYATKLELGTSREHYDAAISVPYLALHEEGVGTETGVGDVIVNGGYLLLPETRQGISLKGSLAIKIPTANEDKGLGTGKTDLGGFVTLNKHWSSFKGSIQFGYIKVGDPEGIDYKNITLYSIGAYKDFARTGVYVSLDGRTSMIEDAENPLELHLSAFHVLNTRYALIGNTYVGLNNGGPDFGVSFGLIRWF